jgi:hypothetical protein
MLALGARLCDHAAESFAYELAMAVGQEIDSESKHHAIDNTESNRLLDELVVVRAAGSEFRKDEIMYLEAPRNYCAVLSSNRRKLKSHQALLPPRGSDEGLWTDPVRVVGVRLVKARPISDRSVNLVCPCWVTPWKDINFSGLEKRVRSVRILGKHGLASDDHDLVVYDRGGGTNDVLELQAVHEARSSTVLTNRRRSCSVRTPANGDVCLSSRDRFVSALIAFAISGSGCAKIRSHSSNHFG